VGGAFTPVADPGLGIRGAIGSGVWCSRMTCRGPDRQGQRSRGREEMLGAWPSRLWSRLGLSSPEVQRPWIQGGVWLVAATGWRPRCAIAMTVISRMHGTSAVRTGSGDPWPDSLGGW